MTDRTVPAETELEWLRKCREALIEPSADVGERLEQVSSILLAMIERELRLLEGQVGG